MNNQKSTRQNGGSIFPSNFLCQSTGESLYETLDAFLLEEQGGIFSSQSWCGTSTAAAAVVPTTTPNTAALPHHATGDYFNGVVVTATNSSLLDNDDEDDDDNSLRVSSPSATSPTTDVWPTKFKIVSSGGGGVCNDGSRRMTRATTYSSSSSASQIITSSTSSSRPQEDEEEGGDDETTTGKKQTTTTAQQPLEPHTPMGAIISPRRDVVLKEEIMDELQSHLPFCKRGESFWLQYSLTRDGASLELLLDKVRDSDTTILAIETLEGEVFGAFLPHAWKFHGDQYYGSGQSFLWRLRDNPQYPVQVFSFAHLNHNIQLMSPHHLILGGSEENVLTDHSTNSSVLTAEDPSQSGFALWLQGDLSRGSSSPCSTFFSPCLSQIHADGSSFEIAKVEAWSLTPCMTLEQAKWLAHQKELGQRLRRPKVSLVSYCSAAAVLTPAAARPGHSKRDKDRMMLQQQQQDDMNLFGTSMMTTTATTKTRMPSSSNHHS